MQKKILIVIHGNTFFIELVRLAKLLSSSNAYQITMFFVYPYPTWLDDASKCIEYQFPCIDSSGNKIGINENLVINLSPSISERYLDNGSNKALAVLSRLRKIVTLFMGRFLNLTPLIREALYFFLRFRFIKKILRDQNPTLLVLGGDMVGYDTSVFIKLAHANGVPTLIVPSTMSNGLEQAEVYFNDPDYGMEQWMNRLMGIFFPRWVFSHRGKKLLRTPGERVLLMELLGLAPPLPWIFNSGFADAIAIESEQMRTYYLDCGLPDDQLCITGSLADDVMAHVAINYMQNREMLYSELGLDKSRPLLLSSLPPDFFYVKGGRPECDFDNYPDLVKFWVQSLANIAEYNIVLCLHPSVRYDDFKYIENWGVKIALKGTADLIPLCDIYVASVSSTIRWAIACGKPVINYDIYRYRYTDYNNVAGVIATEEKGTFLHYLQKLTSDKNYYQEIASCQEEAAYKWGRMDGKVGERLLNLIDSKIALYVKENR